MVVFDFLILLAEASKRMEISFPMGQVKTNPYILGGIEKKRIKNRGLGAGPKKGSQVTMVTKTFWG